MLLIDAAVQADVEAGWECRHLGRAVYPKRGAGSSAGEWMYELPQIVPSAWQEYNDVVFHWIKGFCGAARVLAAEAGRGAVGEVRDALSELLGRIGDVAMPSLLIEDVASVEEQQVAAAPARDQQSRSRPTVTVAQIQ
eukprot:gene17556-biopygen4267